MPEITILLRKIEEKIAGWQAEIDEYANIHQEELRID